MREETAEERDARQQAALRYLQENAQDVFLDSYRELGNVRIACQAAGIHRTTYDYWVSGRGLGAAGEGAAVEERDRSFTERLKLAHEDYVDRLRAKAHEVVFEPEANAAVLNRPNALFFLVKRWDPEFRDRPPDGLSVQHQTLIVNTLEPELLDRLKRALLEGS